MALVLVGSQVTRSDLLDVHASFVDCRLGHHLLSHRVPLSAARIADVPQSPISISFPVLLVDRIQFLGAIRVEAHLRVNQNIATSASALVLRRQVG